jgi:hypothetical protein
VVAVKNCLTADHQSLQSIQANGLPEEKEMQIAGFEYRNGGFGMNHGHLTRTENGYAVNFGNGGDSFGFCSAVEAKKAYRMALADKANKRDFRAYFGAAA